MKAREVTKEYVARVKGEFPVGMVEVEKPVRSINPKVALNAVCEMSDENAKHAKPFSKGSAMMGRRVLSSVSR